MGTLWNGMLFLHGYLSDYTLARRLAAAPAPRRTLDAARRKTAKPASRPQCARLCLGIGDGKLRSQ